MKNPLFTTIHLRDDIANELNKGCANLPETNQLLKSLAKHQVDLQPIYAGIQDTELRRQFYVTTDTYDEANSLVNDLLILSCVDAAYVKPHDESPLLPQTV